MSANLIARSTPGLANVRVNRKDLLAKIKANYEKHKTAYAEAFEGYKLEAAERLGKMSRAFGRAKGKRLKEVLAATQANGDKPVPADLDYSLVVADLKVPESHAEDYETIISMLEFEVRDEIELGQAEFVSFVRDRWSWSDQFASTTIGYLKKFRDSVGSRAAG